MLRLFFSTHAPSFFNCCDNYIILKMLLHCGFSFFRICANVLSQNVLKFKGFLMAVSSFRNLLQNQSYAYEVGLCPSIQKNLSRVLIITRPIQAITAIAKHTTSHNANKQIVQLHFSAVCATQLSDTFPNNIRTYSTENRRWKKFTQHLSFVFQRFDVPDSLEYKPLQLHPT